MAPDPVKVDSGHYTVEMENERVRVLRIRYGPRPCITDFSCLGVFLTGAKFRFTYPDGKKEDGTVKAGDVIYFDAVEHLPENLGDESLR